jgi:hypothetical protein
MRLFPPLALFAAAVAGCGPGAPADIAGEPTTFHSNGSSVRVEGVERDGDHTVVTLLFVNGTDDEQEVGSRSDPPTLTDARGVVFTASEDEIRVPAHSTDRLRIPFNGVAEDGPLTLRLNGRYGSADDYTRDPQLVFPDLEASARYTAPALPAGGSLTGAQVNHANGASVTVRAVRYEPTTTDVDVLIVNGSENPIDLSPTNDEARLLDDRARRYPIVPPVPDGQLRVPEGQTVSGTLRFAGRLADDAGTLTLTFNGKNGSTEDYARQPRIQIPIPVAR